MWYSLGHAGKIEWFSRLMPAYRKHIEKLQRGMRRNAKKILLMAKLSAGLAVPALIAAGLTRVAWRRCFPIVLVGEVLCTSILMLTGYYATEAIIRRADWGMLSVILGLLVIFLLMLFWVIPRALRRNERLSKLAIDDEPR